MRGSADNFSVDRRAFTPRVVALFVLTVMVTELQASGWPPFSRDDEAEVARGSTVTTLLSGENNVLANDFDIERDRLSAHLLEDVEEGTLVLNANGTFVYTNNGSSDDSDEFTYRAFDGTGFSRETRVRIDILDVPNNPPFTTGTPPDQLVTEGIFYSLDLAQYFEDIDDNDSLRFSASGLPGGNRLTINPGSGVLSGTPNSADVRNDPYNVRVTATDSFGASASLNFNLTVLPDNRVDLELISGVAVNPVAVGESVLWEIEVENRGPGHLDQGELVADWTTSGATLDLTVPAGCELQDNNTMSPSMRCDINNLAVGETTPLDVQGSQSADGDSSLIVTVTADDPNPSNNASLTVAVVVAAFSEGPTQVIDGAAFDVDSGDLDGDGDLDIVITAGESIVYFNAGDRTLTTPGISLGSDSGGSAVVLLDWDGDGMLDVAVAGMDSLAGRVYLNDGAGGYTAGVDLNVGGMGSINAVTAADFDSDGDDDLVLAGANSAILVSGDGPGGFATASLPANSGLDATAADINNDGLQDIVVLQSSDRLVRVLLNAGDGQTFNDQSIDRGSVASVTTEDVDNDGDVDLLFAVDDGELTVPQSKVLYQQIDGSFMDGANLGASPLDKLLPGDIDIDGVPDVVAINSSGVHQLYRGVSTGGFTLSSEQIVSDGMHRGLLVDFNGDGSLDLIFVGADAGVVEIHANNGAGKLGLGDRVAPTIALVGEPSITLASGAAYVEMGATATDDIDGDITASVVIEGTVNTAAIGTYTLTYIAADRATNTATVQRTVQVGVNQGSGGGGGGAGPVFLVFLMLSLTGMRRRSI